MNEQRIVEIETKLAHQEYLVSELNQVMARQQETIDQLQTALKNILKNFERPETGPVHEKPPHY